MGDEGRPKRDSGIIPLVEEDVCRACGEIIDAAAVAVINLDFAGRGVEGEKRDALDDVQRAIDRIVELAKRVRRAHVESAK
jgi:hypothetical protein